MIYDGDLIKINGTLVPAIVNYKVGRNKLWSNADRNMAGEIRATLIGIFPKIELNIGVLTQEQTAVITQLLDTDFFEVEYFDVREQGTVKANYYAGDYSIELLDKTRGLYKPFTVSLVPVAKRRY
jgi:hypothetical protein